MTPVVAAPRAVAGRVRKDEARLSARFGTAPPQETV
jgi:hypothetical protein